MFPVSVVNPSLEWLYSAQRTGIRPGLETTRRLLKELQLPGPRQRFIHVAGTNGKGSACAFIESVLRGSGERTALFTSPHLVSVRERMRCAGEMISGDELVRGIESLRPVVAEWDAPPTFFELTLALALDWFDRCGAEWVLLETGMGGRWDATNAVQPVVSVIMPVAMDHQEWLGHTLTEIAAEKAGIIKPGIPVVSAPQEPAVVRVLEDAAARAGTEITFVDQPWSGPLPLAGGHQRWNAAVAVAALKAAGFRLANSTIVAGLAETRWAARFQILNDGRTVLDGAHNPHGAAALAETWRQAFRDEKATLIFGCVAGKDFRASLECLRGVAARLFVATANSPRAVPAHAIAEAAAGWPGLSVFPSLADAVAAAERHSDRTLITGSLSLCGEALTLFGGGKVERSAQ